MDLCGVEPVDVRGTRYWVHELKTQLKRVGAVRVVIPWKKDDLSDDANYYAASHRGWRASTVLGLYARRWEVEEFYRDAK